MLNLYLSFVNYCLTTPASSGELSSSAFFVLYALHHMFLYFLNLRLNLNPPWAGKRRITTWPGKPVY